MNTTKGTEMSNHKPATALPWNLNEWGSVVPVRSRDSIVVSGFSLSCGPRNKDSEKNTQYIAHACNAYPELVEALRELVARCDGAEGVRADGSNIQTHNAHDLLAKLGEA